MVYNFRAHEAPGNEAAPLLAGHPLGRHGVEGGERRPLENSLKHFTIILQGDVSG